MRVKFIPIVGDSLGTVPKILENDPEEIEIIEKIKTFKPQRFCDRPAY